LNPANEKLSGEFEATGSYRHRKYGIYEDKYKAPRRVNFLIGKDGKILQEQIDNSAIDPTKIVDACERPKLNR